MDPRWVDSEVVEDISSLEDGLRYLGVLDVNIKGGLRQVL